MFKTKIGWILGTAMILMFGCADAHLGMRYQRFSMGRINKDSIYCYRFVWGSDGIAYCITAKNNPCLGLNVQQDICLGKGERNIYFKLEKDSLTLYTNVRSEVPVDFPGVVLLGSFDSKSYSQMDDSVDTGNLRRVTFDTAFAESSCYLFYDSFTRVIRRAD
ncbi:MAG TPA: hypothetical protein VNW04_08540 [Puia sp.]|jgi:hypothetical protein|nr:hypothetical protein [Puia sp.]